MIDPHVYEKAIGKKEFVLVCSNLKYYLSDKTILKVSLSKMPELLVYGSSGCISEQLLVILKQLFRQF